MSGPMCPDCDMSDFENNNTKCKFCGWEGKLRFDRKTLTREMSEYLSKKHAKMRQARKESKLYFVRVYVKDKEIRIVNDLMKLLSMSSMSGVRGIPHYHFLQFDHEPTQKELDDFKSIDNVKEVIVS